MSKSAEFLTSGLLGVLCDRLGRWPVAAMTQVGQFIEFAAMGFCSKPFAGEFQIVNVGWVMIVARSLQGALGIFKVPAYAYVADISTPETGSFMFGLMGNSWGLATILAPVLFKASAALMRSYGSPTGHTRLVCALASVLSLLNILIILMCWRRVPISPEQRAPWKDANPIEVMRSTVLSSRSLMIYAVMNFMDAFSMGIMFESLHTFTAEQFEWNTEDRTGFLLALGLLFQFAFAVALPCGLTKFGELPVLKFGYLLSTISFFCFFLSGLGKTVWHGRFFTLALLPFGLGCISQPVQTAMAQREVSRDQTGRLNGAWMMIETLAGVAAPLLVRWAVAARPDNMPSFVFLVAGILTLPGTVLAFMLERVTVVLLDESTELLEEAPGLELADDRKR